MCVCVCKTAGLYPQTDLHIQKYKSDNISLILSKSVFKCKNCIKKYVGSTIKTFQERFNNNRSSITRYGREQRGIPRKRFCRLFFLRRTLWGIEELKVLIIDKV